MSVELRPVDIFLTRGKGILSRVIRFFTRSFGEKRTKVNHVGIIVEGGAITDAIAVEALRSRTKISSPSVDSPTAISV